MKNRVPILVLAVFVLASLSCRFLQSAVAEATPTPLPPTLAVPATALPVPSDAAPTQPPAVDTNPQPVIVSKEYRDEQPPRYGISINSPYMQGPDGPQAGNFNAIAQRFADRLIAEFQTGLGMDAIITPDANAPSPQNFLSSDYQVLYNADGLVSILSENSQYFYGAAHPLPFSSVINYSLPMQRELVLGDLFLPGTDYLQTISDYCMNDLRKDEWFQFEEGAQPTGANYQKWNITPEGLRITFDPYQVAAYAAGYVRVTIPWEALKEILAADGPVGVMVK
jgi:hypothetical protein